MSGPAGWFRALPLRGRALVLALACVLVGFPAASAAEAAYEPFEDARPPGELMLTDTGTVVTVEGRVVATHRSTWEREPYRLVAHQGEQRRVELVYWPEFAEELHGDIGMPAVGTRISARGPLTPFNRNLQIRIRHLDQVRLEGYPHTLVESETGWPDDPAREFPQPGEDGYFTLGQLPELTAQLMGRELSLRGTVLEYREPTSDRAPHAIRLREGDRAVDAVFWWPEEVEDMVRPGETAWITGELGDYRGNLQLVLSSPSYFSHEPLPPERVVIPHPPVPQELLDTREGWPGREPGTEYLDPRREELEPGTQLRLRDIAPKHRDNVITAEGTVRAVSAGSQGLWVILHDRTGYIRMHLQGEGYPRIAVDDRLRVQGTVVWVETRATVELRVESPSGVELLDPAG